MIHITNDKCDFCGTCVAMCLPDAIELAEARYSRHYCITWDELEWLPERVGKLQMVAEKICRRRIASFTAAF